MQLLKPTVNINEDKIIIEVDIYKSIAIILYVLK
jgi:hypothetical protein